MGTLHICSNVGLERIKHGNLLHPWVPDTHLFSMHFRIVPALADRLLALWRPEFPTHGEEF